MSPRFDSAEAAKVGGIYDLFAVAIEKATKKDEQDLYTDGAIQTAAGTRDPATPMVAVPAENGSTNLAGVRSPGIGSDGRLVQMSAKIPLRGCEPLVFRRWVANFKDCASKAKLNGLLQNRARAWAQTREPPCSGKPTRRPQQLWE